MNDQIIMVSLEDLVPQDHVYRKFSSIWQFESISKHLRKAEKNTNYKEFGIMHLFKCLLLQFLEDLSDRELDRYWISSIRSPYERVFSKQRKRVRYCGISKNQFAAFMESICFNLRRLSSFDPPGIVFA